MPRPHLPRRSAALVGVLPLLLLGLAACGDDGGATASGTVSCDFPTDGSSPAKAVDPPSKSAPREGAVAVRIASSVGTLGGNLDSDRAPCTVASFRSLAKQGYFDDTSCHRLTTQGIFVLQCGDPTGTGRGGPGYTIPDELDGKETYPAGTIAMANTGQADTGGSQFFLVYRDSQLPAQYTVFGELDATSVAVLQQVASQGTGNGTPDGPPKVPVDISTVKLEDVG